MQIRQICQNIYHEIFVIYFVGVIWDAFWFDFLQPIEKL